MRIKLPEDRTIRNRVFVTAGFVVLTAVALAFEVRDPLAVTILIGNLGLNCAWIWDFCFCKLRRPENGKRDHASARVSES